MLDPCLEVRERAALAVRGDPDARLAAHAASCEACAKILAGAAALGRDLASWEAPEVPAGLTERTLARIRLADAMNAAREGSQRLPAASAEAPPLTVHAGGAPRRRRSVELLATWALPGPRPAELAPDAPPRERLGLRLAIQAAAAVFLFLACTTFTIKFYPVFAEALEESRSEACQARLKKLGVAIGRFRDEHPDAAKAAEPLHGSALRDALVRGGYAKDEDFLCPAVRGAVPGTLCYFLTLGGPGRALACDHFGNHGHGTLNLVDENGRCRVLDGEHLGEWLASH
jgi:hypothetical protein